MTNEEVKKMKGFRVYQGGMGASRGQAGAAVAQAYSETLGQTLGAVHDGATSPVTNNDVINELSHRGYKVAVVHEPVHHAPAAAPTLTKSMAISVAIDVALISMGIPRTNTHPYRCPASGGCGITQAQWDSLVSWCVTVSNGYLSGRYRLPSWASSALHAGTLSGVAGSSGLSGMGSLGALSDWIQDNSWLVKSVGDIVTNFGEHLTAKNIQDAIKANTDKSFTKDDALSLIAALQQSGVVTPGKAADVAQGANMAATSPFMMPLMIGGAILLVVMLMKK